VPDFEIYVTVIAGPQRSNTNEFNPWSSMTLDHMFDHGDSMQTLSNVYALEHIMHPATGDSNKVLWFVLRVVSQTNNIIANGFSFDSDSSDNTHYLRTHTDLSNTNTVWSPALRGLVWGGDIARSNATIYGSSIAGRTIDTPVRELHFIGASLPYFLHGNPTASNQVYNFILSHSNYMVSGRWSYTNGGSTNIYAMKSLGRTPVDFAPRLGLSAGKTNATLSINGIYGNSVVVFHSRLVTGPYGVLFTGNPGDSRMYHLSNQDTNQGYFKIKSQ
jgi:hypothetical protein